MDLKKEKGRGAGLSLMAQRALVGAIEEEGTRALRGSKALHLHTLVAQATWDASINQHSRHLCVLPVPEHGWRQVPQSWVSRINPQLQPSAPALARHPAGEVRQLSCSPKGGTGQTLAHHSSHEASALWVAWDRAEEKAELSPDHQWVRG